MEPMGKLADAKRGQEEPQGTERDKCAAIARKEKRLNRDVGVERGVGIV